MCNKGFRRNNESTFDILSREKSGQKSSNLHGQAYWVRLADLNRHKRIEGCESDALSVSVINVRNKLDKIIRDKTIKGTL